MRKQVGDLLRAGVPSFAAICLTAGAAICLGTDTAQAQEPPFDPAIDVQLFDLSPGPKSFMSVGNGSLSQEKQFSLDLLLTFLTDPFVIYNITENQDEISSERTNVVSSVFAGQLVGAYGLTSDLQLGVSLPLIFSLSGDGLDPASGDMAAGGLQATGFGDLRVEAKGKLYRSGNIAAAWIGGMSLPTSFGAGSNDFLGDDLPALRGGLAGHWDTSDGRLRLGANLGVVLRKPRQVYASEVGQQLTYGAGAAFKVTDDFSLIGETFGRSGLTSMDLDASPLEVGAGMRAQATRSFSVLAGGGVGVVSGIGSPGLRFLVSVGYAPDRADTDKDGVSNMDDKCPLLAEDMDDFEDSDGCPDDDNDGDRREDAIDKCPNDKEDLDGFEDEDGCPEYDNDGDSILDAADRCPLFVEDGKEPFAKDGCPADKRDSDDDGVSDLMDQCPEDFEDEDGFEDWDGCPEADNDKDGIADDDDRCALCPEDLEGFEDADGCPDLDNDHDLISDKEDQCPDEAEVVNGIDDNDGCPDRGAPAVATLDGNVLRMGVEIRFNGSDQIRNQRDLAMIARVMRMQPDVVRWRIVAVARAQRTEELTRAKSQAQADAARAGLIAAGMNEDALEAIGAVSDTETLAFAALERREQDATEEFVCPAALQAVERSRPETAIEAPAAGQVNAAVADRAPVAGAPVAAVAVASSLPAAFEPLQGVQSKLSLKGDKAQLAAGAGKELDSIAALLTNHPQVRLEVRVHSDGRKGDPAAMSQSQAQVIVDYLVGKGVAATRLVPVGKGVSGPVGDINSSAGRKASRRVELLFTAQ